MPGECFTGETKKNNLDDSTICALTGAVLKAAVKCKKWKEATTSGHQLVILALQFLQLPHPNPLHKVSGFCDIFGFRLGEVIPFISQSWRIHLTASRGLKFNSSSKVYRALYTQVYPVVASYSGLCPTTIFRM